MKSYIQISKHAMGRFQERFGVEDYGKMKEIAQKAINEGINIQFDEALRVEMLPIMQKHGSSGGYVIENMAIFFKDNVVVTVYPIGWLKVA